MWSDDHKASAYTDYLKDTKFLLDEHISELSGWPSQGHCEDESEYS